MAETSELQVAAANSKFTIDMYNVLAKKFENQNVFFSPISAHAVLSMAYQGAAGQCVKDFETTLHISDKASAAEGYHKIMEALNSIENVTLYMANKAYVMKESKLKPTFESVVREKFLSEVEPIDFAANAEAAKIINSWVKEKTKEKITKLFEESDFDKSTRAVLLNAIYFKGNWFRQFKKENTRTEPFYVDENTTVDCQMMHITGRYNIKYDNDLKVKILQLPYTNTDVSMFVFLPYEKNGIADLEAKLATIDLDKLLDGLHSSSKVIVALPKFKLETTMNLKEVLEELGLGSIFDEKKSDFSEMLVSPPLVVSEVIQKAFIEVNEEGSEAAAVTDMRMYKRSLPPDFIADRPFFVFVASRLDDGKRFEILFFGKITKPHYSDSSSKHDEL